MVRVAIEGCCHGELNKIYSYLKGSDVELLLICGDFQAIRNRRDLKALAVPSKYLQLGDFHEYYSGKRLAPIRTIFIGGNHESSSYLKELKFGGWVAPNIYYLGEYGTVWYRGLRVSGISGIYNDRSFLMNYYKDEILPYTEKSLRSVYHVRPKNMMKMLLEEVPSDIVLSHDWPQGIELRGDSKTLFRIKPHFKADSAKGFLGSPVNRVLLQWLQPRYWFLAHMHVRYKVNYKHKKQKTTPPPPVNEDSIDLDMDMDIEDCRSEDIKIGTKLDLTVSNPDAIQLDMEDDMGSREPSTPKDVDLEASKTLPSKHRTTEFLALDKCLPRRKFLEFMDIVPEYDHISVKHADSLFYDARANSINKVVEKFIIENEMEWKAVNVRSLLGRSPEKSSIYMKLRDLLDVELKSHGDLDLQVPENFEIIAPTLSQEKTNTESSIDNKQTLSYWPNNQTRHYCDKFGIPMDKPTDTGSS